MSCETKEVLGPYFHPSPELEQQEAQKRVILRRQLRRQGIDGEGLNKLDLRMLEDIFMKVCPGVFAIALEDIPAGAEYEINTKHGRLQWIKPKRESSGKAGSESDKEGANLGE